MLSKIRRGLERRTNGRVSVKITRSCFPTQSYQDVYKLLSTALFSEISIFLNPFKPFSVFVFVLMIRKFSLHIFFVSLQNKDLK